MSFCMSCLVFSLVLNIYKEEGSDWSVIIPSPNKQHEGTPQIKKDIHIIPMVKCTRFLKSDYEGEPSTTAQYQNCLK